MCFTKRRGRLRAEKKMKLFLDQKIGLENIFGTIGTHKSVALTGGKEKALDDCLTAKISAMT